MQNPSWKSVLVIAGLAVLAACGVPSPDTTESSEQTGGAALTSLAAGKLRKSADAIPGQYIVVPKDAQPGNARVPEVAQALAREHGATVTQPHEHALQGFAMTGPGRVVGAGGSAPATAPTSQG